MNNQYLPLTEYSTKYHVSISTLRRRIKAEDIGYVFEDGKYLILDQPMSSHQRIHRPSQQNSEETLMVAREGSVIKEAAPSFFQNHQSTQMTEEEHRPSQAKQSEDSVLAVANRLLTELKKAYSQILQEKEEQILMLKEEAADLKTLVRVLESENERLSRR
ncbi:MAG: hypothetical protein BroJett040_09070 [Oligoflexia bacterium]|nr:MAG: hypothetical protein BroJett040_09070 [Oligoflexia bacterium]